MKKNIRKQMKNNAKAALKIHYGIFVIICIIAAFLGTEYTEAFDFIKRTNESSESISSLNLLNSQEKISDSVLNIFSSDKSNEQNSDKSNEQNTDKSDEQNSDIRNGDNLEENKSNNEILSTDAGVFASIARQITTKSFIFTIVASMNSVFGSKSITYCILIILGTIIIWSYKVFISDVYKVIMTRMFLEGRVYEKVHINKFFFLIRCKKWIKASWTMFVKELFFTLWSLTIVGRFIKKYSYFMVPYIVAENPDIDALDAINLSRKMMDGHKWECFVMELSFLGWDVLEVITMGISGIIFSYPYKTAAFCEYYTMIRIKAKYKNIQYTEYLNDSYLFKKPKDNMLKAKYKDILADVKIIDQKTEEYSQSLFTRIFGIILFNNDKEREYEEKEELKIKIKHAKDEFEGKAYPNRLFTLNYKYKNKRKVDVIHYMRHYSVFSLIIMFTVFSFIGWAWEVAMHLVTDGVFVNRGILHGPYLPIYGVGGVLILVALNKFRSNIIYEFISAIVLCGFVEYFTAYYLEMTHNGKKWWDYTGYFLNLHGRICAEGLLVFGLGGMLIVYLLAPLIDNQIRKINNKTLICVCSILLVIYCSDVTYSSIHPNEGKGITDYAKIDLHDMQFEYSKEILL